MDVFEETQNRIIKLENMAATMKLNLDSKLSVIRNIQEYEQQQMSNIVVTINDGSLYESHDKIICGNANIIQGIYDKFGSTIHPQLLKVPSNVFNFKTTNGYYFKDNGIVTINEIVKPKYKFMLSHDSITGQDLCFEEYDTPVLEISIRINPGELLGTTAFNLLEIVPFLPGSFDIVDLQIFSVQGYYTGSVSADSVLPNQLLNVGVSRILIDQTINLYELKMTVYIHFKNSNGRYPFGIKHLYFLNANFNPNSYAVFKVTENRYIDTISENITVADQAGTINTSCKEENIKLYTSWSDGVGANEIVTSKGLSLNPIVRNINTFYVYYPILRSVMSLQFDKITLRS